MEREERENETEYQEEEFQLEVAPWEFLTAQEEVSLIRLQNRGTIKGTRTTY